MSPSISQRFPGASSVGFSWEMLLAGPAAAWSLSCFGTDWGRRGHASLESSRSLVSLKKSHRYGATSSQLLLCTLAGGLPEHCLPGWAHAMATGKCIASMGTSAACHQPCLDCSV